LTDVTEVDLEVKQDTVKIDDSYTDETIYNIITWEQVPVQVVSIHSVHKKLVKKVTVVLVVNPDNVVSMVL